MLETTSRVLASVSGEAKRVVSTPHCSHCKQKNFVGSVDKYCLNYPATHLKYANIEREECRPKVWQWQERRQDKGAVWISCRAWFDVSRQCC